MSDIKDIIILGGPGLLALFFFFLFLFLEEIIFLLLGILCGILFLFNGIYRTIQEKKPSFATPEEINKLKNFLEEQEIKEFIHHLHHEQHKNIYKIALKVERKY